jgi:spoIIIJ-associated protein
VTDAMGSELAQQIVEFLTAVMTAMGAAPAVTASETRDGLRIDIEGDGAEALLLHRGEALRGLQTVVNAAFRRQLGEDRKILVDCQGFRRDKDAELRQMARFLGEKVARTGASEEMGPLNSYERRIVHLAVAELEGVTSESIGDAAVKTVIISARGR